MRTPLSKLPGALLLALSLTTAAHAADEKEAALQKAVQAAPQGSEAQKRAGQQLCVHRLGPIAVALWTADGTLICERISFKR